MKKLLSVMLALVLVLGLSTVAFADTEKWDGNYKATEAKTFNEIEKTYTSENNVVVNETLSFTSTASASNPDQGAANLTVADLTVSSLNPGTLTVTIPSLSVAGTYEWTIKETAGNTAGVTYSSDEVHVIAVVGYDNVAHALKILNTTSYIKKEDGGTKAKTFENTFKSGSFTVAKDVIGNMANESEEFKISVTLTSTKPIGTSITVAGTEVTPTQWTAVMNDNNEVSSWTYTSTLNYSELGGAKTFSNIPVGVTVTVTENTAEDKMNGYTKVGIYSGEYTVDGTTVTPVKDEGSVFSSLTVEDDTNTEITVVNKKETNVETGIALDSVPYVLILAVACIGMALLLTKKRAAREF